MLSEGWSVKGSPEDKQPSDPCIRGKILGSNTSCRPLVGQHGSRVIFLSAYLRAGIGGARNCIIKFKHF